MAKPKKSFTEGNNPALDFISDDSKKATPEKVQPKIVYVEKEVYHRPEAKSRRVQILVKPSLYEEFKGLATAQGKSVGGAINDAMQIYIQLSQTQEEEGE